MRWMTCRWLAEVVVTIALTTVLTTAMPGVFTGESIHAADNPRPALPATKPAATKPPEAEDDAEAKQDLEAMQGTWAYEYTNKAGARFRVEKAVVGERDTVTHFDQQGNLIHTHVSEFELRREGPFRVFVIRNTLVTAGPDSGERRPGPRSFAYRIEGEKMIEVWGLLETDRGAPRVVVWDRVKK
jgi:hypothetical protein